MPTKCKLWTVPALLAKLLLGRVLARLEQLAKLLLGAGFSLDLSKLPLATVFLLGSKEIHARMGPHTIVAQTNCPSNPK